MPPLPGAESPASTVPSAGSYKAGYPLSVRIESYNNIGFACKCRWKNKQLADCKSARMSLLQERSKTQERHRIKRDCVRHWKIDWTWHWMIEWPPPPGGGPRQINDPSKPLLWASVEGLPLLLSSIFSHPPSKYKVAFLHSFFHLSFILFVSWGWWGWWDNDDDEIMIMMTTSMVMMMMSFCSANCMSTVCLTNRPNMKSLQVIGNLNQFLALKVFDVGG